MAFPFAGVGSIISGLGGLFGSRDKPKQIRPGDAMVSQARGAREAADKYGFNPLTMMQYGQTSGAGMYGGGGTPPLASIEAITGGFQEILDENNGTAAREREAEQLNIDLAKVKLDQARAELRHLENPATLGPRAAPAPVSAGAAPLGRPTLTKNPARKPAATATDEMKRESIAAPDRQKDVMPVSNSPGVFEMNNSATLGRNIWVPGDGEPWGIDEAATALIVGVPQVIGGLANDYVFDGKRVDRWWSDNKEKREKREREKPATKKPDWETGNFPQSPFYQ